MACGGQESKDGSKDWRQQLDGGVHALRIQETRTERDSRVAFGTLEFREMSGHQEEVLSWQLDLQVWRPWAEYTPEK